MKPPNKYQLIHRHQDYEAVDSRQVMPVQPKLNHASLRTRELFAYFVEINRWIFSPT